MSDKLEDPQYPHDPHQPDHLTSLADDLKVLQTLQQQRQVEWNNGADINDVHGVSDKLDLVGTDDEPDQSEASIQHY